MPVTSTEIKRSTFPVIAVGIIVVVVVMFVLKIFLFTSGEESNTTLQALFNKVNFSSMKTRNTETKKFNFGVISDDKFNKLNEIKFKVNELDDINIGKENLFSTKK